MSGYLCFQIELTRGYDYSAFREDLKKLYMSAGVQGKNTVFLFTDTQVKKLIFGPWRFGFWIGDDLQYSIVWLCFDWANT